MTRGVIILGESLFTATPAFIQCRSFTSKAKFETIASKECQKMGKINVFVYIADSLILWF